MRSPSHSLSGWMVYVGINDSVGTRFAEGDRRTVKLSECTRSCIMAVDLTTRYLGLTLRNPLVVAPCPLTNDIHMLQQLEEAGAAAVELVSLFEEQIRDELEPVWLSRNSRGPSNAVVGMRGYNGGLDSYLRHIELARGATKIPIIASVNAMQRGDWTRVVRLIESRGCGRTRIERLFRPHRPGRHGTSD